MAELTTRKMTFSLPTKTAEKLLRRVPAQGRSRFVSDAVERMLSEEHDEIARACLRINKDSDVKRIEKEWDNLVDEGIQG